MERCYVMVKPVILKEGDKRSQREVREMVKHHIVGEILKAGLTIKMARDVKYTREAAEAHYHEHEGRGYYEGLVKYITSGLAFGMVVEGDNAISTIRGENFIKRIRREVPEKFDTFTDTTVNVMHASDCKKSADLECEIFEGLPAVKTTNEREREI